MAEKVIRENLFLSSPHYQPLPDAQEGLIGQVGVNAAFASQVYDWDAPVWQMQRPDGSTWQWRHRTHCFGHPAGTCQRELQPDEDIYCDACGRRYAGEAVKEQRQERTRSITEDMIAVGALPRAAKDWGLCSLHPSQADALAVIDSDKMRNVWLSGDSGRGKSTIAQHLVARTLRQGRDAAYIGMHAACRVGTNVALLAALTDVQLLVLDDAHLIEPTSRAVTALHSLLELRHTNSGRTLVTSQIDARHFQKHCVTGTGNSLAEDAVKRLTRRGHPCLHYTLDGPDLRAAYSKETTPQQQEMET